MSNKKLGRGLGAIFGDDLTGAIEDIQQGSTGESFGKNTTILLSDIRSNPYQPRTEFDDEKIKELAVSIRQHGIFTPILVREAVSGYELIAGERRVRASRLLDLETIPAIIVDFDDDIMLEVALLENIQREDLHVIDEANAYKQMMDRFKYTQAELAERVGKTRTHVANLLRLLNLPESVQQMVVDKQLTMGHVRPLITLESDDEIIFYAKEIIERELTVREVEELMRKDKEPVVRKEPPKIDPQLLDVQKNIASKLATKVKVNKNNIQISYGDIDDLNRILQMLNLIED